MISSDILKNEFGIEMANANFNTLGLDDSPHKNTLSFIDDDHYLSRALKNNNISGLLIKSEIANKISDLREDLLLIIVDDPRYIFYSLLNLIAKETLRNKTFKSIIHETSVIHQTAFISSDNVIIGENVIIEPNVTILQGVEIGKNAIVRAGAVLGTEGFEHKRTSSGILSVVHDGRVIIGENVHIGSCSAIAKGFSIRDTIIGDDTKIDNLVHIAHGVHIGKRCFLPASCMIAGSTTISDDVWIGPNASVSSQIKIDKGAFITLGSVVTKNVEENSKVTGNFAIDHNLFLKLLKKDINSK